MIHTHIRVNKINSFSAISSQRCPVGCVFFMVFGMKIQGLDICRWVYVQVYMVMQNSLIQEWNGNSRMSIPLLNYALPLSDHTIMEIVWC